MCTRLYTLLCPSVGRSVGPSVGWSVAPHFTSFINFISLSHSKSFQGKLSHSKSIYKSQMRLKGVAETVMLEPSISHHNFFLTFKWLNFWLIYSIIPHSLAGHTVIMIIFLTYLESSVYSMTSVFFHPDFMDKHSESFLILFSMPFYL